MVEKKEEVAPKVDQAAKDAEVKKKEAAEVQMQAESQAEMKAQVERLHALEEELLRLKRLEEKVKTDETTSLESIAQEQPKSESNKIRDMPEYLHKPSYVQSQYETAKPHEQTYAQKSHVGDERIIKKLTDGYKNDLH